MAIFIATSTATEPESEKKTWFSVPGRRLRKALGQRQRRFVHQPAQHHMRHLLELGFDGGGDMRMVVAMGGGPPAGDAVDQLAPVGQHDARAIGARRGQRRAHRLHLGIGQPDMREAAVVPIGVAVAPCDAPQIAIGRMPRRSSSARSWFSFGFGVVSSLGP